MLPRLVLPIGVALFLLVLGVAFLTHGQRQSEIGGPFRLTSTTGGEVTDSDFEGHPFLVYFGYTHCPDICPTTLSNLSLILKVIDNTRIKAVFITVDPQRDTPAKMKEYLASFNPNIIGLSGTVDQIESAEKAYRVHAAKVPSQGGGYTMDHTSFVFLMDKHGRFVAPFDVALPPKVAVKLLSPYF